MSANDALELIEYWSYCPPLHVSHAAQAGLLRDRPRRRTTTTEATTVTATDFQTLSAVAGGHFRGVNKMPPMQRELLEWAEKIKKEKGLS